MKNQKLTRRNFLTLSAGAAAGSLLAACGAQPTPEKVIETVEVEVEKVVTATPEAAAELPPFVKGEMRVFPTSVTLPTNDVTFRWLDSGDTKAVFMNQYFELYQQAYPNITTQYDGLPWNEIAKIVPLGLQNEGLHDVFSIPDGITSAQAYAEGWIRPLDDLIPDLEELKSGFPAGSFVEGINVFDGKTYTLPFSTNKRSSTLLLYNQQYMAEAGYDPMSKSLTWDEFRDAAKKITQNGNGEYYGLAIGGNQLNRWGAWIGDLARIAGAAKASAQGVNAIDYRTGEYVYASDEHIAAMELFLAMKDDGSVFPGFLSMNAPQARAQTAQGGAGMILQGTWCLPQWKLENPDFVYGAAHQPIADSNAVYPLHVLPGGDNEFWIYSQSKVPEVAADIFYYRGTLEGQYAWNAIAGVSDPGIFPEALETAGTDPVDVAILQTQTNLYKIAPAPQIRNPHVAKINLELQGLNPSFPQVIQGLASGQLTDIKAAFQDVQDRANAELDRAIKAAQDKGAQVSRDDYVFADWDPTKDYL